MVKKTISCYCPFKVTTPRKQQTKLGSAGRQIYAGKFSYRPIMKGSRQTLQYLVYMLINPWYTELYSIWPQTNVITNSLMVCRVRTLRPWKQKNRGTRKERAGGRRVGVIKEEKKDIIRRE
jgi:hypothetical protein